MSDAPCTPTMTASPSRERLAGQHRAILAVSLGVVAAAFLLRVRPDQRVELLFLPGWPLPETCQSRALLGWECPGCGLTRSFVHLAHGEWPTSLRVHRLGWLLALAVVLQVPYRLIALRSATGLPLGERAPWAICWTLVALLVANWGCGLIARLV